MKPHLKNITLGVIILFTFLSFLPQPARADVWGSNWGAAILKQTMEEMYTKIKETVVANAKISAIRIVQGRLQTILTGSPGKYGMGGTSMVITDWQDFIYGTAAKQANTITSDFFSTLQGGASSFVNNTIIKPAQNAIDSADDEIITPDIENYVREGKATKIFSSSYTDNSWKAWRASAEPQNDPGFIFLEATIRKKAAYEIESEKNKAQGIAYQGYRGAETKDGQIKTPGSTIKSIVDEIEALPIKMLEFARSIPEIVTSMVTQMLTQMINQGIAQVTQPIDQQIVKFRSQVSGSVQQIQNQIKEGSRF